MPPTIPPFPDFPRRPPTMRPGRFRLDEIAVAAIILAAVLSAVLQVLGVAFVVMLGFGALFHTGQAIVPVSFGEAIPLSLLIVLARVALTATVTANR